MENSVYLVPGNENRLTEIGDKVHCLGFDVYGRELIPPFFSLYFREQLKVIQRDLTRMFWHRKARLIGHSYGGYLLLHALSVLEPFPGEILLFSPVLGAVGKR